MQTLSRGSSVSNRLVEVGTVQKYLNFPKLLALARQTAEKISPLRVLLGTPAWHCNHVQSGGYEALVPNSKESGVSDLGRRGKRGDLHVPESKARDS